MEQNQLASFVLRFHLAGINEETNKKLWRIKVTHVQENEETLFESIEEAIDFIKNLMDYS